MTTLADRLLPDQRGSASSPCCHPHPPTRAAARARTVSDRACMAAIIFMARTSTPWALLPVHEFGCGSVTTCWRRFAEWAHAGAFERLQELLLDELGEAGALDWSRVSVDSSACVQCGGTTLAQTRSTGPSPAPSCTGCPAQPTPDHHDPGSGMSSN